MNYDAHALWSESVRIRDLTLNEAKVLRGLWCDQVDSSLSTGLKWRGLEVRSSLVAAGAWYYDGGDFVITSFITSPDCSLGNLRRFSRDLCWRLPVYQGAEIARAVVHIPLYSEQSRDFSTEQRIWDKKDSSLLKMLAELGWQQVDDSIGGPVNMRWSRRF